MATNDDMNYADEDANTTDPDTTDIETDEEQPPLEDQELEIFKESLQGRSKNTIKAYLTAFREWCVDAWRALGERISL